MRGLTETERVVIRAKAAHSGIDAVIVYVEGIVAARVDAAEQRVIEAADGIACPDCEGDDLFGPALRAALARPTDEATPGGAS